MFQLLDKLSNEMFMYIKTLNFSEAQAKIIYKTYLKFIKEKYKTYSSINYENANIPKSYLKNDNELFKKRLNILANAGENAMEYINFIKENKYGFDMNLLNDNDKRIYKEIIYPTYNIYEKSLMFNEHNYVEICNNAHYLAVKFGYTKDLNDKNIKTNISYKDSSKMPEALKDAIKGVEK